MKLKKSTTVIIAFVAIIGIAFSTQSFAAPESAPEPSEAPSAVSTKKFVKTRNKCSNSHCSCSGYWGYKHENGTYEGSCSNSDGWGHTCGHGPEKHGLKKW